MSGSTDLMARLGVEVVRTLTVEMGYYPREPSDPDYGIDVLVETALDGVPNGRMLALQVKSGPSRFQRRTDTHVAYRCSDRHARYWLGHSLPVAIVLYDPDQKVAYWQVVSQDTVVSTGDGWTVEVPFDQIFGPASETALRGLAKSRTQAVASVDWARVLSRGPLSLLSRGEDRYRAAVALRGEQPQQSAAQLVELASELEDQDGDEAGSLETVADRLRTEAAATSAEGDDNETACQSLLVVVRRCVVAASQPISIHTDRLRIWLAPDRWWIANAWKGCLDWPEDPEDGVHALTVGVDAPDDILVTDDDRWLWRERLVEILLVGSHNETALARTDSVPELGTETFEPIVRLHALRAETLGLLKRYGQADEVWQQISHWCDTQSDKRPALCATLAARRAVALVRRGHLDIAQHGFADAALTWGRVLGAEDEVAEQYFSGRTAESLIGDPWPTDRQHSRSVAANLRGRGKTPSARAERLERQGLNARVIGQAFDALNRLWLAVLEHQRAGHLRGALYATHLLIELYEHVGEYDAALEATIQCGRHADAERLATQATASELVDALEIEGPIWTRQPSLAALAAAGRHLDAGQVIGVANWVLEEATQTVTTMRDRDRVFAAHGALSALVLEWPADTMDQVTVLLLEALKSGNLLLAEPAATALEMLTNASVGDFTDPLTEAFLESEYARVSITWVAARLTNHDVARDRVLAAATEGRLDALEVACTAEINNPGVHILNTAARQTLDDRLRDLLTKRLGHTSEGHVIGLLRLEPWGLFARISGDQELRGAVARKLLEFALNDDEPHSNRTSAVNAIFNLAGGLEAAFAETLGDQLRPIAVGQFGSSVFDQPRAIVEHPLNRYRFGEYASADRLRGAAVLACVALVNATEALPAWPTELMSDALVSPEPAVVTGALEAISRLDEIPIPQEFETYLLYPDPGVRGAALMAWRQRKGDTPSPAVLDRLATDENLGVRLRLLGLLRDGDRTPDLRAAIAENDPDSYVRAMARAPIRDTTA
jgi:Domain of unknown function (DUF4365)